MIRRSRFYSDYVRIRYMCLEPYTAKAKHKLEMVQKRAARYVTRRYHNTSSVTQMQCYLHWQTLDQRRAISGLTMLYKITNNLVAIPAI